MSEPIKPNEFGSVTLPKIPTPTQIFSPPNPKFIISAFGLGFLKPKFYRTTINEKELEANNNGKLSASLSDFGLPVFDELVFNSFFYEQEIKQNSEYKKQNVEVQGMLFGTVLIDVSQSKNVISTPISGRNGTVKEYISDGDYMINIKGVLTGKGVNVEPIDEIQNLIKICKSPVAIDVASDRLSYFGISSIVIKEYNFTQLEGQKNVVPFELICLSDTPFEITQSNA